MNAEIVKALAETVQHNCHIADARHAGDYTLCVYLLKMREMYRWEQGESFKVTLTTDDVGDWLTEREGVWDDIEEQPYQPLHIDGKDYDPFDNEVINTLLDEHKLVYNAGLGIRCRPHFFLAALENKVQKDGYTILVSGQEYARDMAAPPAMAQDHVIYIRQESLRRMLWEKIEEWRMSGLDNPVGRAAAYYCFEDDVEQALDDMAAVESKIVVEHEIGEMKAGQILGKEWLNMVSAVPGTHAEIMLRSVRDHLADSLTTLHKLIEDRAPASIHFYFGNLTAMRKKLAPALVDAYTNWHETGSLTRLETLLPIMSQHWESLAKDALAVFTSKQEEGMQTIAQEIENLIEQRILL